MSPWSGAALSPLLNGQRTNNKRGGVFSSARTRNTYNSASNTLTLT